MTEEQVYANFQDAEDFCQTQERSCSNSFKVSGVYSTLLGRQDLNYTSPVKAKYIRKRDRNRKDVNLYRVYHTRNLDHIQDVKLKQLKLKQQGIDAKLQHQQLLDRIKQKSAQKRNRIRSRSKSFSSLPSTNIKLQENTDINMKESISTKSKPAWALTSQQHDIVMDQEVDELLDFVNTLDIEDYLENLELQQKLTSIQDRIENFKKQQKELETNKLRMETNEQSINVMQNNVDNKENLSIINTPNMNIRKTNNIMKSKEISTSEIAHQILNTSENIKNIHSKQSLSFILDTTKCKPPVQFFEPSKNKYNEPTISIIRDRLPPVRERQNLNGNDINNLPYLYRHPGV